jgi:hypothetical protein
VLQFGHTRYPIVFHVYDNSCSLLMQVLKTRNNVTVHGPDIHKGLSDIAFTSIDDSRLVKEGNLREKMVLLPDLYNELVREQTYSKFVEESLVAQEFGYLSRLSRLSLSLQKNPLAFLFRLLRKGGISLPPSSSLSLICFSSSLSFSFGFFLLGVDLRWWGLLWRARASPRPRQLAPVLFVIAVSVVGRCAVVCAFWFSRFLGCRSAGFGTPSPRTRLSDGLFGVFRFFRWPFHSAPMACDATGWPRTAVFFFFPPPCIFLLLCILGLFRLPSGWVVGFYWVLGLVVFWRVVRAFWWVGGFVGLCWVSFGVGLGCLMGASIVFGVLCGHWVLWVFLGFLGFFLWASWDVPLYTTCVLRTVLRFLIKLSYLSKKNL